MNKAMTILMITVSLLIMTQNQIQAESSNSLKTPILFFREKINITLDKGEMILEGDYYFRNLSKTPSESTILYPLICNEDMPFPYYIEVEGKKISRNKMGVCWMMRFERPHEEQKVRVVYKQKLSKPRAVYIVLSTKEWGVPLELAEFNVNFPETWKNFSTSYSMPLYKKENGRKHLKYSQHNFWPEKDMVFSWIP